MFRFFRRLQWKLTLSYAVVTSATVIILLMLLVGFVLLTEMSQSNRTFNSFYWSKSAFQDNIPYLLDDPDAMEAWLNRVQAEGFGWNDFQSYTVRETLDYANTLKTGAPIYVLDPDLNLIAAAPPLDHDLVGAPFRSREASGFALEGILTAAQVGHKYYNAQSQRLNDGSYIVAFPLRPTDDQPVVAIVVYQLRPPGFVTPSNLSLYSRFFLVVLFIMLAVALPVGALFGWLVSRGLRRRLTTLSAASQAWSKGDFSVSPRDRSGDEIGELTRNLAGMAEQLQSLLSTRRELARVEERNRLARELHDTVKQQTYAARMQLSAAKNLLPGDPETAVTHLDAALQLNRETQQELKLIIEELRPAALEGKGLAEAVLEYAERWQKHTGIQAETAVRGERPLPLDVEQTLYRVLQESLSNVARHAEAETVAITLDTAPAKVTLTIADNGRGFDMAAIPPKSLGLTGMKQRLQEVGGQLRVVSTLAVGSKIIAEVDL
jgi:two-component system, NarL family, sensor histidine kinase LiaS